MAKHIPSLPAVSTQNKTSCVPRSDAPYALTHEDGDDETTGASTPMDERPAPAPSHEARQSAAREAQAARASEQCDPAWIGASAEKQGTMNPSRKGAVGGHGYAPDIAHGEESGYGPANTVPGVHPRFGRQSGYGPHDDYVGTGRNTAGARPLASRPPSSQRVEWPDGTVEADAAPRHDITSVAQRSGDEALRDDIHRMLAAVLDLDISHIDITVTAGQVLLTGDVPERWMQHEVQAIVSKSPGVIGVDNRLHERRAQSMSRPGESQEGHKI